MPQAKIVQTAQRRPGGDFLTGDNRGPFLDTGVDLGHGKGRYGNRIYLSLKHLAPILRDEGWLTADDAESIVEEIKELRAEAKELREVRQSYEELTEVLADHVEPRVVEKTVVQEVSRAPTEEELTAHVVRHRRDILLKEQRGSDAHYEAVYKGHGYIGGEATGRPRPGAASEPKRDHPSEPQEPVNVLDPDDSSVPTSEERDDAQPDSPISTFELQGQVVRLDDVLEGNIKEVIEFAKGHPDEFLEALVLREYELGELKGKPYPRKGVIEGLGYEFEGTKEEDK